MAIKVLQTESNTAVKEQFPAWFLLMDSGSSVRGHTKMDNTLLLAAIEISDSMRRTAVKITPVKGKVDLNSSDYKTYSSFCDYAIRRRTGLLPGRQSMWMYQQCATWMDH